MHYLPNTGFAVAAIVLATSIPAQFPRLVPEARTLDLLVVDSSLDGVWRLSDRDQDGSYNSPGEIITFYDDVTGSIALSSPTCVVVGPIGTAYVGDSSTDIILALRDNNGDGDANDPGEHWVYFDSATNASNVVMASVLGITSDAIGNLFLAVANSGSGGNDVILQLTDSNGDGDANDLGEAIEYCRIPNSSGAVGDSLPNKVVVAPDANLYYTDVGATGVIAKGVYKLVDLNGNGTCNDPGEVIPFWIPTGSSNGAFWGFAVDPQGVFYLSDHTNEIIWTASDNNSNGMIDAGTSEETLFYQSASSTWWDLVMRDDGWVLACEDQTPDRVVAFQDMNNDGDAGDPGESFDAYSELSSPTNVTKPRAAALMRAPLFGFSVNPVVTGGMTVFKITASKSGDFVQLLYGPTLSSLSLPPFGVLELGLPLVVLGGGMAGTSASLSFGVTVPADPALIGSWPFQAVAGDAFRPYLSDPGVLVVQ